MRALALLLPVALAGCGVLHHRVARQTPPPSFDVRGFFVGATHGEGRIEVAFKRREPFHVHGFGRIAENDILVIDQDITERGKPPRHRQWRIRETAPGLWIGSLSDAAGPVVAEVNGDRLAVTYPLKGGLAARQTLAMQPGGRTVSNRIDVSKAALHVATVTATLTRD